MNHPLTYHQMAQIHQDNLRREAEAARLAQQAAAPRRLPGNLAALAPTVVAILILALMLR